MKWTIGDVTVTKIVELEMTGGSRFLLPQATPEAILPIAWLRPHFADENGRLRMSIQAFIVQTPTRASSSIPAWATTSRAAAFRTGTTATARSWPTWPRRAFRAESIDTVLCTHLHVDHVGWNTMTGGRQMGADIPARKISDRPHRIRALERRCKTARTWQRSWRTRSRPIVDAGLATLVETTERICDEISLIPTIGHTPGHVSVMIESKGEQALITGDFMHHPCQIAHPEWETRLTAIRSRGIADSSDDV